MRVLLDPEWKKKPQRNHYNCPNNQYFNMSSKKKNIYLPYLKHCCQCCHHLSDLPSPLCQPMPAFAKPLPPFVSQCQHLPSPFPPLVAEIVCERPLITCITKISEKYKKTSSKQMAQSSSHWHRRSDQCSGLIYSSWTWVFHWWITFQGQRDSTLKYKT